MKLTNLQNLNRNRLLSPFFLFVACLIKYFLRDFLLFFLTIFFLDLLPDGTRSVLADHHVSVVM